MEIPSTKPKQREALVTALMHLNRGLQLAQGTASKSAISHLKLGIKITNRVLTQLHNRSPITRAAPSSDPMTPEKVKEILRLIDLHPEDTMQQIAVWANVTAGRVSEVLAGKRH